MHRLRKYLYKVYLKHEKRRTKDGKRDGGDEDDGEEDSEGGDAREGAGGDDFVDDDRDGVDGGDADWNKWLDYPPSVTTVITLFLVIPP